MMSHLLINDITKKFGNFFALKNVNFELEDGEFLCLLGPSGCGKTTLLRIIAGLEEPDSGKIFLNGKDITSVHPSKRKFGIVFQSYALFPNMTAYENITFGLKNKKSSKNEMQRKINELFSIVNLDHVKFRYPSQLSGGEQQRVALARALALDPDFLLLDEPLSALDAKVRNKLRKEIRETQEKLKITTIMVTHDQEEALTMADRIVVMDKGKIMQIDIPQRIYELPANPFVADFIGDINFIKDNSAITAIRPENICIDEKRGIEAKVYHREFRGAFYRLTLCLVDKNQMIKVDIPSNKKIGFLENNERVFIELPADKLITFKDNEYYHDHNYGNNNFDEFKTKVLSS
ncbi:ATP-binding cassette domain-containing protein [bacterium]|nr:ATP-binding cassette domain-containing protein [bacterium]